MQLTRLVLLAAAVGALACSDDPSGPSGGHSTTISVRNTFFTPSPDTVAAGQVTFTWVEGTHNVTWDSGPTTPANIANRSSGSVPVTVTAGTYNYHCSLHLNMNGVIVVQ